MDKSLRDRPAVGTARGPHCRPLIPRSRSPTTSFLKNFRSGRRKPPACRLSRRSPARSANGSSQRPRPGSACCVDERGAFPNLYSGSGCTDRSRWGALRAAVPLPITVLIGSSRVERTGGRRLPGGETAFSPRCSVGLRSAAPLEASAGCRPRGRRMSAVSGAFESEHCVRTHLPARTVRLPASPSARATPRSAPSGGRLRAITKPRRNCSPGGSTGYSLSWLRQSTAFPCRAMVVATSGL